MAHKLRYKPSPMASHALAMLACVTRVVSIAIVIDLAVDFTNSVHSGSTTYALASSAAVFNSFALVMFILTTFLSLRRFDDPIFTAVICVSLFCDLVALTLSLAAFGTLLSSSKNLGKDRGLADAGIAITILMLISTVACYIWTQPRNLKDNKFQSEAMSRAGVARKPSLSLTSLSPHPGDTFWSTSVPGSPPLSTYSSPLPSARQSVSHFRLTPSKTRLLRGPSIRDSRSIHSGFDMSTDTLRGTDEFENWDTSAIAESYAHQTAGSRLTPIPGSRPVSPARALDGPFPNDHVDLLPEDLPSPESPSLISRTSPSSDAYPHICTLESPSRKLPNSESHIHPLFRSESPVPPPLKSPNTVITASPFAGQVMSHEAVFYTPRVLQSPSVQTITPVDGTHGEKHDDTRRESANSFATAQSGHET